MKCTSSRSLPEEIQKMGGIVSTLVVESAGLLTTVQDLGRVGYGPMGVSASWCGGSGRAAACESAGWQRARGGGAGNDADRRAIPFSARRGHCAGRVGFCRAKLDGHFLEMWIPHAIPAGGTTDFWRDTEAARAATWRLRVEFKWSHFWGARRRIW